MMIPLQRSTSDPGGEDIGEPRRVEKLLIARMLDLDEPVMTEKVRCVAWNILNLGAFVPPHKTVPMA